MNTVPRFISALLLVSMAAATPGQLVFAQETRDRSVAPQQTWSEDSQSTVKKAKENVVTATLADEPVMRIALSTGTSAATISTTAKLLTVSDLPDANQPLDTTRVRVESRMLTPSRSSNDHSYEMTLASGVSREDADGLANAVRQNADEQPQVIADSADKWKVIIQKQTTAEVEEARAKLDDAGIDVIAVKDTQKQVATNTNAKAPGSTVPAPAAVNRLKYTARAASPNRELVAFARGSAPSLRSSAPLLFASSDEKNAPVRFNE